MNKIDLLGPVAPLAISKLDAAANTAASCSKAASVDDFWAVNWVAWSYSGTPTAGKLTIVAGSTTILEVDITLGGADQMIFDPPLFNTSGGSPVKNEALTITLAAAGASVVGKVTAGIQ